MTLLALTTISLAVGGNSLFQTEHASQIAAICGLWIGSMLAFLLFQHSPSSCLDGDSGGLAFGGTIAVLYRCYLGYHYYL